SFSCVSLALAYKQYRFSFRLLLQILKCAASGIRNKNQMTRRGVCRRIVFLKDNVPSLKFFTICKRLKFLIDRRITHGTKNEIAVTILFRPLYIFHKVVNEKS